MIHSIQDSQNRANNSREDTNAEDNVNFFNTEEMDIMEITAFAHICIWKLQMFRTELHPFLGSSRNSKVYIWTPIFSGYWTGN